jgi:hypothetical protein
MDTCSASILAAVTAGAAPLLHLRFWMAAAALAEAKRLGTCTEWVCMGPLLENKRKKRGHWVCVQVGERERGSLRLLLLLLLFYLV